MPKVTIQVPMLDPMFPNIVTRSTFPTLFLQNREALSNARNSCASLPVGAATFSCVYPANQPAARVGFRDVIGEATDPTRIERGCPLASRTPKPVKLALTTNHAAAVCFRASIFPVYPIQATEPRRNRGMAIISALGQTDFSGSSLSSLSLEADSIAGSDNWSRTPSR